MGNFFSRSAANSATINKLKNLTNSIQSYEKKRKEVKTYEKKLLYQSLYTTVSMTLCYALIAYNNKFFSKYVLNINFLTNRLKDETSSDDSQTTFQKFLNNYYVNLFLLWLPVLILPLCYLIFRTIIKKCYRWRIKRWDKKILNLRKQKTEILDKVMDTETFNNAKLIFEEFDPSRLRSNFGTAAYMESQRRSLRSTSGSTSKTDIDKNRQAWSSSTKIASTSSGGHNKTFTYSTQSVRYRGSSDISHLLPSSVVNRNRTASQRLNSTFTDPYSGRNYKSSELKAIGHKPSSLDKKKLPTPPPEKKSFFSRFNPLASKPKLAKALAPKAPKPIRERQASPRSHNLSTISSKFDEDDSFIEDLKIPKLDAEELKFVSKKAGVVGRPKEDKKSKRDRSKSKSRDRRTEKKSIMSRSKSINLAEQGDAQENSKINAEHPEKMTTSKSLKFSKNKTVILDDNEKELEIERLKQEIEMLKNKDLLKYSVKGRIEKSVCSDKSKSSKADLIKKNRSEMVRKRLISEKEERTVPSSMESLANVETSTRSSLDSVNLSENITSETTNKTVDQSETETMKNSITTIKNPKNEPEINEIVELLDDTMSLDENNNQSFIENEASVSDVGVNSLAESLDLGINSEEKPALCDKNKNPNENDEQDHLSNLRNLQQKAENDADSTQPEIIPDLESDKMILTSDSEADDSELPSNLTADSEVEEDENGQQHSALLTKESKSYGDESNDDDHDTGNDTGSRENSRE